MPSKMPRAIAIDTETTGLSPRHGARAYAISACDDQGKEFFWEWDVDPVTRYPKLKTSEAINEFRRLLSRYGTYIFHNAKFDIRHLHAIGALDSTQVSLGSIFWSNVHDTLPMSHVLDSEDAHDLKYLAKHYLQIPDDDERDLERQVKEAKKQAESAGYFQLNYKETTKGRSWVYQTDYWILRALNKRNKALEIYARRDAERTIRLYLLFREALKVEGLEALYERERKLIPIVYAMESEGLPIHKPTLHQELTKFTHRAGYHSKKIEIIAASKGLKEFNPDSPKQLGVMLYQKLRFPGIKETAKSDPDSPSYSTNADTLEELRDFHCRTPDKKLFLTNLLSYRAANTASKYLKSYLNLAIKVNNDARRRDFYYAHLYPSLNQNGTGTTRFSSQEPNAQNISKESEMNLRAIFGPLPGFFWLDFDYSNIELRIFAWLANEKPLMDAFHTGVSVHRVICEALHGPSMFKNPKWKDDPRYGMAKNGTFSIIYGAGESRADATYGVDGAYKRIRKMFPGLENLMNSTMDECKKKGYVTTLLGYRLYCPKERAYASLNYKIQGSAGDVMKYGMLNVAETVPSNQAAMILTVHDELIFKVPDTYKKAFLLNPLAKQLATCMEEPGERIGIPCPVSKSIITTNWSEREELTAA